MFHKIEKKLCNFKKKLLWLIVIVFYENCNNWQQYGRCFCTKRKYDKYSEITILSKEKFNGQNIYYSPVVLPYYIERKLNKEQLFSKNISFYEKNNAKILLDENVKYNNSNKKIVITDKHSFSYDKLIIASGASARKLNIPGAKNAFVLRTYDDAEKIKLKNKILEHSQRHL